MGRRTSSLLINESPLQALPSLACLVGISGAIILQQIHYWLQSSEHRIENHTWIYNTYDKWSEQFKWLKPRAIQKQILLLEKSGYLVTKQFKYKAKNNTKWYRINYGRLNEEYQRLIDCEESNSLLTKNHSDGEESIGHSALSSHKTKLNSQENTQESTQENTTEIDDSSKFHPLFKEFLAVFHSLPYWKANKDDPSWLVDFLTEFPELKVENVIACRDYWDGKRIKHKGQWKSRLRNWMKIERGDRRPRASQHRKDLPGDDELERKAREIGIQK